MTRAGLAVAAVTTLIGVRAEPARAQSSDRHGRVEIAAGPRWTGGLSLSAGDANETTSEGSAFRLFTASTTLARAASFDVRFGVRLTPRLDAQVSGGYGRPSLRISVSNDIESAAPVTATERIQQFTLRGGVSWSVLPPRRRRLAPFVAVDVGYLREVHAAHALVQTGRVFEAGGGAKIPFTSNRRGRFEEVGARVDARAVLRSRGAALDDGVHTAPTVGASLYVRF